jgi:KDO2-lipid IV(A) lauroyltransferase
VAKKKFYRYPVYLLARMMMTVICVLPRKMLLSVAKIFGRFAFYVVVRQREKALRNLKQAYGTEKSDEEINTIARKVFENIAQSSVEVWLFRKLKKTDLSELIVNISEVQRYRDVLKENNGLIGITAHIGNWELLPATLACLGFEGGVVARKIYYEPYNRWIVGLRRSAGVETFYRDESPRRLLKLLKSNKIIGIVPDQNIDSLKGIFVDFFGHLAYTTTAPAKLAIISGAPILPNFLIREDDGRYRIVFKSLIRVPKDLSKEEANVLMTRQWMKACEDVILEFPEQWAWMHDRWKTKVGDIKNINVEKAILESSNVLKSAS